MVSDSVVARAAEAALDGAQPLAHNGYKIPLTQALARRALQELTSQAGK
jgi:CO/xanthine dehydrogenase FAD-binding subunit